MHVPDLYGGRTFETLATGIAHAEEVGFGALLEQGRQVANDYPTELVYVGMSLGVMPAQLLAQTRQGAQGAVLLHAAVPLDEFGPWPNGVPLQIHTMESDEWGDAEVARELADAVNGAEVYLYPGDRHLFTDDSLPDHDPITAEQVIERVLTFLARVG